MSSLVHTSFYRFVPLAEPEAVAAWLRERAVSLLGSVLVAGEGVSGALAGEAEAVDAFERAMQQEPRFTGMSFKHSTCRTPPFGRLAVHVKPEIVSVGVPYSRAAGDTQRNPAEWRALIARDDVVLLDNRNAFEYRLGRFPGALDPGVRTFRDFPRYVLDHAEAWKAEGREVAMYCTGGIRCEKTAAWMQGLGLTVHELQGGILNYFQAMPDAHLDWQGECFVFDNRIALDTRLRQTATTAEQVYAGEPDGAWRLARAKRLHESV
jgi:UPF0176 protein